MSASRQVRRFTPTVLFVWGGLLLWATYFLVLYMFVALACERGFADLRLLGVRIVPASAALGFAMTFAATAACMLAGHRRLRAEDEKAARFIGFLAWALGLLGLLALAWTVLPALLLRTGCA
jgi:hypothetical protein